MSPAPLRPALALVFALALLAAAAAAAAAAATAATATATATATAAAAAAAPAQRAPSRNERQLSTRTESHMKKMNAFGGGPSRARRGRRQEDNGSTLSRVLGAVAAPTLQLLGAQAVVSTDVLEQLAGPAGARTLLALFRASAGASSGGVGSPAFVASAESYSDEVQV